MYFSGAFTQGLHIMLHNARVHCGYCMRVLYLSSMCAQVLIFDFDVHHGNGTNDVFYEDPSVLFISTHQANIYPGTGGLGEIGRGDGEGASINLPLPGAHQNTRPATGKGQANAGAFELMRLFSGTWHASVMP